MNDRQVTITFPLNTPGTRQSAALACGYPDWPTLVDAVLAAECQGVILSAERIAVIEKVAELWRGDWSGREFDGRDGAWWLRTALKGTDEELAEVRERLRQIDEDD